MDIAAASMGALVESPLSKGTLKELAHQHTRVEFRELKQKIFPTLEIFL